jgi:hypothetical protein
LHFLDAEANAMETPSCRGCGSFNVSADRDAGQITCRRCGTVVRHRFPPPVADEPPDDGTSGRWWQRSLLALAVLIPCLDLGFGMANWFWPTASGTIVDHQIAQRRAVRSGTWYTPSLTVAVPGAAPSRTPTRFRCHGAAPDVRFRGEAITLLAAYPLGSGLAVRVDPTNALAACLWAGTPHWPLDLALIGAVLWWGIIGRHDAQQRPPALPRYHWQARLPLAEESPRRWRGFLLVPPGLLLTVIAYDPVTWVVYAGVVGGVLIFGLSLLADTYLRWRAADGWVIYTGSSRFHVLETTVCIGGLVVCWLVLLLGPAPIRSATFAAATCLLTLYTLARSSVGSRAAADSFG